MPRPRQSYQFEPRKGIANPLPGERTERRAERVETSTTLRFNVALRPRTRLRYGQDDSDA